jgi:hypothetical protein
LSNDVIAGPREYLVKVLSPMTPSVGSVECQLAGMQSPQIHNYFIDSAAS